MAWNDGSSPQTTAAVASFNRAVAPVQLPDGARIREFSCFGRWRPDSNLGKKIRLRRKDHTRTTGGEVLAAAEVFGGEGVRRVDATLDHVVDNFSNAYQVGVVLNANPSIVSCRVGYEPPAP